MVSLNFFAIALATLSSMIVGAVFYSPKVLGRAWMRLARVDRPEGASAAIMPLVATVILSFITALILALSVAIAAEVFTTSYLAVALLVGLALWVGFTAARITTHDAFESRPPTLTALTCTHELITVVAMALIIGGWPPAPSG